jgi:hypothetical protein
MKKLIFLASLLLLLLGLSCGTKVTDGDGTLLVFVSGTVTDSVTQAPIDSAWLDSDPYSPYSTYTDSSGGYLIAFTARPGSNKVLHCGKQGYISKKKEYKVTSPDTAIVNFQLSPLPE